MLLREPPSPLSSRFPTSFPRSSMGPDAHRKDSENARIVEVVAEMVQGVQAKFICVYSQQSNPLRLSIYRHLMTIESPLKMQKTISRLRAKPNINICRFAKSAGTFFRRPKASADFSELRSPKFGKPSKVSPQSIQKCVSNTP